MQEVVPLVSTILTQHHQVQKSLGSRHPASFDDALNDMRQQAIGLCRRDFLIATPFEWLRHYPRYLQAIQIRLGKLQSAGGGAGAGVQRDARLAADILALQKAYGDLVARGTALGLSPTKIEEFRWHLEELRVSVFAQELRTSVPVSVKRMEDLWTAIVKG